MTDYNFLNLSPTEFEELARDILQIREQLYFESFNSTKDQGIDFRHRADGVYIMLQAKRYKDYDSLRPVLVNMELPKVKRQKPTRYILVAPVDFTVGQKKEIKDIFQGFIGEQSDIIGKKDLNNLLSQAGYKSVQKNHYKLWLGGIDILEDTLDKVVYRTEHNINEAELYFIRQQVKYYVQNKSFPEALDRIEENKVVLISGTPGIGKTTLGRALVSYFMATEGYELVYIISSEQAWSRLQPEKKQIFFYDDFIAPILLSPSPGNEHRLFTNFIERMRSMPDKILVLTTREYVLRQAQRQYAELKKDLFHLSKCFVSPETYSDYIKAKILYNHLFFSDLSPEQIHEPIKKDNYEKIVYHGHYSPRLVDDYIRSAAKKDQLSPQEFYKDFIRYLDHPREFWRDIFDKQTTPARLFLVVLFSLNQPVYLFHLQQAYDAAVAVYMRRFNDIVISPDTWENILKELSDTFISINLQDNFGVSYLVRFQNPSIKDFLLEYLRGNLHWQRIIIDGAVFLNQLLFAFSMNDGAWIEDEMDDEPMLSKAIHLTGELRLVWRDKFIRDFDTLGLSTQTPSAFTDMHTLYTPVESLLTFKLNDLLHNFGTEDAIVREFAVSRFQKILRDYQTKKVDDEDSKILQRESMTYFPHLIEKILPFVSFDPWQLLNDCYNSITSTSEFISLHRLGELFPEAFARLLAEKGTRLRRDILEQLEEDAIFYEEHGLEADSARLFDQEYDEVLELYQITVKPNYKKKLYKLCDTDRRNKEEWREYNRSEKERKKEQARTSKDIDSLFASLQAPDQPSSVASDEGSGEKGSDGKGSGDKDFDDDHLDDDEDHLDGDDLNDDYVEEDDFDEADLLEEIKAIHDSPIMQKIGQIKSPFLRPFSGTPHSLNQLTAYFDKHTNLPEKETEFWDQIFGIMYDQVKTALPKETLQAELAKIALQVYISEDDTFTEKEVPDSTALFPLIIRDGHDFSFLNRGLLTWLTATGIRQLPPPEKEKFYTSTLGELYVTVTDNGCDLWRLLLAIDGPAFANHYLAPILIPWLNKLSGSDDKALFLSWCREMGIEYNYAFDENRKLYPAMSKAKGFYIEYLTAFLRIDLDWTAPSWKIPDEFIKKYSPYSKESGFYRLKLTDHLENPEFYPLMRSAGLDTRVVKGIAELKEKIRELCNNPMP